MSITIRTPTGDFTALAPDWATESTLKELLGAIKNLPGGSGLDDSVSDDLDKIIQDLENGLTDLDDALSSTSSVFDKVIESGHDFVSLLNTGLVKIGNFISEFIGGILKSSIVGLVSSLGFSVASIKDTFDELRSSFSELTKMGLNLSQGFGEDLAMGTKSVMDEFLSLGLSMSDLTTIMTQNSFAFATNRKGVMSITKEFNRLTESGNKFGLSVAESNKMLADEMDFKSKMLYQDKVDSKVEAELAEDLFASQMHYTKLLGMSIDDIRKTAQGLLKSSSSAISLVMLQGKAGTQTLTALTSFTSGLVASGFSEEFTSALLEAGTGIDIFASEVTRTAFSTLQAAGVDIQGELQDFRNAVQDESLTVQEATEKTAAFTNKVANMSNQGIETLRIMAAAGDNSAAEMLSMVNNVRQARESARKLSESLGKTDPEDMYKKILGIDTAMSKISGAFTRFRQAFATSFLPALEYISKVLSDDRILRVLEEAGNTLASVILGTQAKIADIAQLPVENAVNGIIKFVKGATEVLSRMINFVKSFFGEEDATAEATQVQESLVSKIGKGIGTLIVNILAGLWNAISSAISAMNMGSILEGLLKGTLGVAGLLVVLRLMGASFAIKGALTIGILAASIWAITDSFKSFQNLNWDDVWEGIKAIGVLVGGGMAIGAVTGALTTATGGLFALGMGVGAASILAIAHAVDTMADALTKISKIPKGALEGLVPEIKNLAGALLDFSTAALGGDLGALKAFFGGDKKTMVGFLADDLERLVSAAKTAPPAITSGLGLTAVNTQPQNVNNMAQTAAAAAAVQNAAPTVTREQELLQIMIEKMDKSLTVLKEIKTISENSAT